MESKVYGYDESFNKVEVHPKAYTDQLAQDNLLFNSDWKKGIINQKGQKSYVGSSSKVYAIDMWACINNVTKCDVLENKIKISNTSSSTQAYFGQQNKQKTDDYLTVAIFISSLSGTIEARLGYYSNSSFKEKKYTLKNGLNVFTTDEVTDEFSQLNFILNPNSNAYLEYAKVEKGKYFTNMAAWNEAIELLKCYAKYYCFNAQPDIEHKKYVLAVQVDTNKARMTIDLPTKINKTPSVKVGYLYIVNIATGGWHLVTSITAINYVGNKLTLDLQTQDNISSSVNNPVYAMFTKDGYLVVDIYDY